MNTVNVLYVGKKPFAMDNVAKSGKAWNGEGDVQQVTPAQAKILCKYPDQWQLVDPADTALLDRPVLVDTINKDGEAVQVDAATLNGRVDRMDKPTLLAYAKKTFDRDLNPKLSRKVLLDEVEALTKNPNAV